MTLCFKKDESIILRAQGTLKTNFLSQIGYLYLTNKRLLFVYSSRQTFDTPLDKIIDLGIEKKTLIIGVRVKHLAVKIRKGLTPERIYIALVNPEEWIMMIKECMTLLLAERWDWNEPDQKPTGNTE